MDSMTRIAGVVAALLTVFACVPRVAPAAVVEGGCVREAGSSGERTVVVSDPPGVTPLGAEPFTARCTLPAEWVGELRGAAPDRAVLYVEGMRLPVGRAVTVDVWLDERTVAGSFTLLPEGGDGGPVSAPVLLGHAIFGALRNGTELTIMLRAVDPANEGGPPPALTFDRIVLQLQ